MFKIGLEMDDLVICMKRSAEKHPVAVSLVPSSFDTFKLSRQVK